MKAVNAVVQLMWAVSGFFFIVSGYVVLTNLSAPDVGSAVLLTIASLIVFGLCSAHLLNPERTICLLNGGHDWSKTHGWYNEPVKGAKCNNCGVVVE